MSVVSPFVHTFHVVCPAVVLMSVCLCVVYQGSHGRDIGGAVHELGLLRGFHCEGTSSASTTLACQDLMLRYGFLRVACTYIHFSIRYEYMIELRLAYWG